MRKVFSWGGFRHNFNLDWENGILLMEESVSSSPSVVIVDKMNNQHSHLLVEFLGQEFSQALECWTYF